MKKEKINMNAFLCTGYVNCKNEQYKVLVHTDYSNINDNLRRRVIEELGKMNIKSGNLNLSKHGKIENYTIDEYGLSYSLKAGGGVSNKFITVMVLKEFL